jgi:hypothetical protein
LGLECGHGHRQPQNENSKTKYKTEEGVMIGNEVGKQSEGHTNASQNITSEV